MPHHSYLVESGLPVEDGEVPIPDVPLHLVPTLQVEVTALWVESQVNPLPRVPDDVLGLRVLPLLTKAIILSMLKGVTIISKNARLAILLGTSYLSLS